MYRDRVEYVQILKNCSGEYWKMVESVQVPKIVESGRLLEKSRICANTEKLSGGVLENGRIIVSTEKWQNPGENREKCRIVRIPKNCLGEYWKRVKSV